MSQSQNRNGQRSDLNYWIVAVVLIMLGFTAPVGFLMIVLKLLGGNKQRGRHPYYAQQEGQATVGAKTASTTASYAPESATQQPSGSRKKRGQPKQDQLSGLTARGKSLITVGGIISAIFGFAIMASLGESSYWLFQGELRWFLAELVDIIPLFCFLAGGLGCMWAGLRKRKQARRYRNYLAMIGAQQSVTVSSLAAATGVSSARVRDDLEDMLNDGIFPQGFLDYSGDLLVLSGDGLSSQRVQSPQPPKQEEQTPHEEENAILGEIKAVNDAVANEKLSAQIDRIGIITSKILEYQKNRPEKAPQMHSFLSYYLPTTLKILRAYGQLESQEISGANITAAMQRIEGMMDKVVEGFEKQLDQLFQGDAMDITTDVEVLERMLAKDGLSANQGLTLGL